MTSDLRQIEALFLVLCRKILNQRGVSSSAIADGELVYALEALTIEAPKGINTLFLSGISGVGKSTVALKLEKLGYKKVANVTTRPRRSSERAENGIFISENEFKHLETTNQLFYPHIRNGVWQAIMLSDIKRLIHSTELLYMDKSLASIAEILATYPELRSGTAYIYLLPPAIDVLHQRICTRESSLIESSGMSNEAIMKRFEEEIDDMKYACKIKPVFIVNDQVKRVIAIIKSMHGVNLDGKGE